MEGKATIEAPLAKHRNQAVGKTKTTERHFIGDLERYRKKSYAKHLKTNEDLKEVSLSPEDLRKRFSCPKIEVAGSQDHSSRM